MRRSNPAGTVLVGGIAAKKLLVAGAAIWGLYAISKRKTGGPMVSLVPAPVKAGQAVTAESYRVIKDRRSGMDYIQATGQPGSQIGFTPPRDGIFTRNTVFEGGVIFAELK